MAVGWSPTAIGCDEPVLGSIRTTWPFTASATQSAPSPTAIAFAEAGTLDGNTGRTSFDTGSTRSRGDAPGDVDPNPVVTQAAPSPVATPVGAPFVDFTAITVRALGSIR